MWHHPEHIQPILQDIPLYSFSVEYPISDAPDKAAQ
jgi:hypothetical protein